jgi:hypothetical protein
MSMLWNSITAGLKILGFWQTYIVAMGMTVIVVFPKLYLVLLKDRFMYGDVALSPTLIWYLIRHHWVSGFDQLKERAYKEDFAGGFKGLLALGLAEFLGCYFAILTLLPLMIGIGTHANWALPWTLPFHDTVLFLKIVGTLLLTIIIVTQVPVLGKMLIYPLSVAVIADFLGVTNTVLVPSFWLGCGFVLAGVAVQYAVIGISGLVVAFMPAGVVVSRFSSVTGIIFLCLLPVLNLLPAFIYAGWISHQL